MQYTDSDSQRLLRENTRNFLAEKYPFERLYRVESGEEPLGVSEISELAELGWFGLAVPEEHGGGGVSLIEAGTVVDEFGYAAVPAPVALSVVAARILASANGAAGEHLAALASGERLYTVSEATRARGHFANEHAGRDGGVAASGGALTGSLPLVPHADLASYVLAPITVDGDAAFAALPLAGASLEQRRLLDRSHFFDVTFDGLALEGALILARGAEARTLHERCDALTTAMQLLELGGAMQRCMEMSARYISERVQFGQPVAKFQAARHRAAELLMQTETTRGAAYHAAWVLDADPDDSNEVWLTKHWAIRAIEKIYAITHLLHGGVGVGMDYPVHLFTLYLAGAAARAGTMNELTERIFDAMEIPESVA